MKLMNKKLAWTTVWQLTAALAMLGWSGVQAQTAGTWMLFGGITSLQPQVESGNLTAPSLPNTRADVNSSDRPTGAINYSLRDEWVISVPLGLGFSHDVSGAGAIAGVGTIATTKALPVTALGQYRFMAANAQWRPYLGAGLTYAKFYDTKGTSTLSALTNPGGGVATTVQFDSKLAPSFQVGTTFNLNDKWSLDANLIKTLLSTKGTLSTGQTLEMRLDPLTWTLGVGYKF